MHLVLVLQQVVLKKITLNFITQYCVVTFTCNNFARKLLIRSLVSILHNLFSIYRTAYFILSTISDQNKKPVFWGKNSGISVVCLFLHAASVLFLAPLSAPFSYSLSHDIQKHWIHVLYNQGLSRVGVQPQTSDTWIPIMNVTRPISCQSNNF